MEPADAVLAHTSAEISRTILQHSTRRVQLLLPDRPLTVAEERVPPINRGHPLHHHTDQWKPNLGRCKAGGNLPEPLPELSRSLHRSSRKPDGNGIPDQVSRRNNRHRPQLGLVSSNHRPDCQVTINATPLRDQREPVAIREQWRIDLRDPILRDIIKSHSASNGCGSEWVHKTSWFLCYYKPQRFHRGAECNESRGQQSRSFNRNSADH